MNGQQTLVWIDNWLFDGRARRPIGNHSLMNIKLTVGQLFHQHTGVWNDSLLRYLFHYSEINIIKAIKPRIGFPDSYCWTGTRNGIYSVKTGYELMFNLVHKEKIADAAALPSRNPVFQDCWKVKTEPKIRVFLWKALKGALPVFDRLQSRGLRLFDGCMFCGEMKETINHILFLCPFTRLVWALSNIPSPLMGYGSSIFQNLHHLFSLQNFGLASPIPIATFTWILWNIWKNRNSMLFEGFSLRPDVLLQKAWDDSNEWSLVHLQVPRDNKMISHPNSSWCPPFSGEVKCNIGFAWTKRFAISGASWVVRDCLGNVLLHSRRSYVNVTSAFDAKIKSWEWALESMHSLNMEKVIFGASTLEIIQALHNPNHWPALVSHITPLLLFSGTKPHWLLSFESTMSNLGATMIATSVTSDLRLNSYVASGSPFWMTGFFTEEQRRVTETLESNNTF